jgi:hypothetical protein
MRESVDIPGRDGSQALGRRGLDLLIALGLLLCGLAAAMALGNERLGHPYLAALVSVLIIAAPLALGIYALRTQATPRFGVLLVGLALGLFVTTLGNSEWSLPYSVGRVAGWWMEVALIYALLAYPTGRLTSRAERIAVGAGIAVVALLYMPATFVIGSFPVPTPWTGCTAGCPPNAFQIFSGADLGGFGAPLREAVASALFIAVGVILAVRVRRTSPLARTALVPVLAVAICRFVLEGSFLFLRGRDVSTGAVEVVSLAVALTIPLIALGFLLGLLRWRMRTSRALALIGGSL